MGEMKLVGIGLFILFTLPAIVAAGDRRNTHDMFHIALALAGLAWACVTNGLHGFVIALSSGLLVLVLLASTVALTQRQWRRRVLTGGEIKFATAAAIWLLPLQAVVAIVTVSIAMILWSFAKKTLGVNVSRPDVAPFMVLTVLLFAAIRKN